jgi:hypothetical protein
VVARQPTILGGGGAMKSLTLGAWSGHGELSQTSEAMRAAAIGEMARYRAS